MLRLRYRDVTVLCPLRDQLEVTNGKARTKRTSFRLRLSNDKRLDVMTVIFTDNFRLWGLLNHALADGAVWYYGIFFFFLKKQT